MSKRRYYNLSEVQLFKRFFGIELSEYWENPAYLGFDVIKFDSFIETPDNKSTLDHVRDTYSREAMELVALLTGRV